MDGLSLFLPHQAVRQAPGRVTLTHPQKAGLIGFTKRLAMAVGKYGITANVMAPGFAETAFVMDGLKNAPADFLKTRLSEIPLGRGADPSEMAAAIAFLASDDASYITGAVLDVNGGSFIA